MSWFDEQIRKRKEIDQETFEESVLKMTGALMGQRITRALNKDRKGADDAIGQILEYYDVKSKDINY